MDYSSHFLKIVSLFLILLLIGVQLVVAQEPESGTTDPAKSWALEFQINENFSLSSFQGSTISAKYHFSPKRAMRFGISLSGSIQDQELDRMRMGLQENNQDKLSLVVMSQYLFYSPSAKNFRILVQQYRNIGKFF